MRNYQTKSNQGALPDSITSTRFGGGEFNSIAVELEGAVTTSGQTLAPADGTGEVTDQLAMALAIYGAGGATYHVDTGAVNAYVLTPVSPKESPNAYFNGFSVVFEPGTVNTTVSTVNVGGLGVKSITLQNGTALSGGEISGTCCLKYNLGDDRFELIYSSDSALKISQYYEIDASQADQGATSTNSETMTIYDVATLVGTSKFATIRLSHNPASGNQTYYTFDTSLDLTSYPYLFFESDPGAQIDRNTGDETLTIYSPDNINAKKTQKIFDGNVVAFAEKGTSWVHWWGDTATDWNYGLSAAIINKDIRIAPGEYDISVTLLISDNGIILRGAGRGAGAKTGASAERESATILTWTGSDSTPMIKIGKNAGASVCWGCSVKDLALDADGKTGSIGFDIEEQAANTVLERVAVIRTAGTGIYCSDTAWKPTFYNVGVYEYDGLGFDFRGNNHNCLLLNCQTQFNDTSSPTSAIRFGQDDSSAGISIIGCDFESGPATRYLQLDDVNGCNIHGCYFEADAAGVDQFIRINSSTAIDIRGNTFQGSGTSSREAIYVTGPSYGVVVEANHAYGMTSYFINSNGLNKKCIERNNVVTTTPTIINSTQANDGGWRSEYRFETTSDDSTSPAATITYDPQEIERVRKITAYIIYEIANSAGSQATATFRVQKDSGGGFANLSVAHIVDFSATGATAVANKGVIVINCDDTGNHDTVDYQISWTLDTGDSLTIKQGSVIEVRELDMAY